MAVAGTIASFFLGTVEGAWKLLMALGAGTGSVYLLRWYWWRINAWSEISAMAASFVTAVTLMFTPLEWEMRMVLTVLVSTIVWVSVTYLTKPEPDEHLIEFCKKVKPGGRLWKPIEKKIVYSFGVADFGLRHNLWYDFRDWIAGCISLYATLFGLGKLILVPLLWASCFLPSLLGPDILSIVTFP